MNNLTIPGLSIEPAAYGGFVVYERYREPGLMAQIAFAGQLAECLDFIRDMFANATFKATASELPSPSPP